MTLEDEEGMMNLILRPQVYEKYRPVVRNEPLLTVTGEAQRKGAANNLLAQHIAGF